MPPCAGRKSVLGRGRYSQHLNDGFLSLERCISILPHRNQHTIKVGYHPLRAKPLIKCNCSIVFGINKKRVHCPDHTGAWILLPVSAERYVPNGLNSHAIRAGLLIKAKTKNSDRNAHLY